RLYRIEQAELIVQDVLKYSDDSGLRRKANGLLARAAAERADFEQSYVLFEKLIEDSIAAFGPDHRETRALQNQLADIYRRGRKYDRAEPLFRQVAEWQEEHLGREHS